MHILHIVGSISPEAGGPTEAIRMLIRHQPPGYSAEVVTLDDPGSGFLADFPFRVTPLGSTNHGWYVPALSKWLKENRGRFGGVVVHGLWEYTGFAALRAFAEHIPYVVFPHGMLDPYFKKRFPLKHYKKWLYWLAAEYWVLRSACRVLFTTAEERDLARQSFALARWTPMVVALGAEPPSVDRGDATHSFYSLVPALEGPRTRFLLFLGRIDPKKGCDLLVDAFLELAGKDPNLHLVMAGPDKTGWGESTLVPRIANAQMTSRVHWPGMLKGEAKWGAFAACEAFVLPSHQENFGIAVVEALACGKPVLLSNQINIAAEIAADGCGLVESDTLEGTLSLLSRWAALSTAERAAMGEHALQTFATRYDMRRNTEAILRVFELDCPPANAVPDALLPEAH